MSKNELLEAVIPRSKESFRFIITETHHWYCFGAQYLSAHAGLCMSQRQLQAERLP